MGMLEGKECGGLGRQEGTIVDLKHPWNETGKEADRNKSEKGKSGI